jgi:hypothetical protein
VRCVLCVCVLIVWLDRSLSLLALALWLGTEMRLMAASDV